MYIIPLRKAIEKQTQQSCASFMMSHKWRRIRNNPILASDENGNVFSASEPGMPDELYLYYFGTKDKCSAALLGLWIEYKKPGEIEKPGAHQDAPAADGLAEERTIVGSGDLGDR